jgi:hypothetical protein
MLFNYSDTVVEDVTISGILGGGSVLIRTGDLIARRRTSSFVQAPQLKLRRGFHHGLAAGNLALQTNGSNRQAIVLPVVLSA